MLSTQNHIDLPDRHSLQKLCKALAVLEAILCPEWEYRYYSYQANWDTDEECFEMRDGQGDQMLILFQPNGCIIHGFAHEATQPDKQKLTHSLPATFHAFLFGEPVATIGTTFCLWQTDTTPWQTGFPEAVADGSEELLAILDSNPETYIRWAQDYYDLDTIPLAPVAALYQYQPLTREMVLALVPDTEDWQQLEADVREIGYPFELFD